MVVTITDVNEPPAFDEDAPTLLRVREITDLPEHAGPPPVITLEDGETEIDDTTFAVTDRDGEVTGPDYSVSGTDSRSSCFQQ